MGEGFGEIPPEAVAEIESAQPADVPAENAGAIEGVVNTTPTPVEDAAPTSTDSDADTTVLQQPETATEDQSTTIKTEKDRLRKAEIIGGLVASLKIDANDVPQLQSILEKLSPGDVEMVSVLLENQAIPMAELDDFLKLPKEQQQEQYTKELIIDQMIKDELFEEKDREMLRQKELKGLRISFGALQENALNKNDDDSAINRERPSNVLPNVNDKTETGLTRKDVSQTPEVSKTFLQWTDRGGKLDQAIAASVKDKVETEENEKLEKEAYEAYKTMSEEERLSRQLVGEDGSALKEGDFVNAYLGQRLSDESYQAERQKTVEERIQAEVEFARTGVDLASFEEGMKKITGKSEFSEADQAAFKQIRDAIKAFPPFLKEQLRMTRDELVDQAFQNDFMTVLSLIFSADSAYNNYRAIGKEGENGTRLIGKEQFERAVGYPESFALALAQAYQKQDFQAAGFKVENPELFAHALKGDQKAIRDIFESFLEDLFDSQYSEKRWEVARKFIPEAMFPGINARFEEEMKDYLEILHDDENAMDRLFKQAGNRAPTPKVIPLSPPQPAPDAAPEAAAA